MTTETGEISIVCDNCERDIPAPNIDLHRVHCARNLEKCKICGDMVPKKHVDEHFLNAHAPAWNLMSTRIPRASEGDKNGRRRRRDGKGASNKRLFFTISITGIAVLIGSLFFQRKPKGS